MMAPSPHVPVLMREAVLPKVRVLFALVSRVLDLPPRHPGVQRGVIFAVVPAIVLLVAPRPMRETVLPAVDADPQRAVDELVDYALAGLAALRARHRAERGASSRPGADQAPATRRTRAASKSRT
jgi:hypothetical protein